MGWALLPPLFLPNISFLISDVFLMAKPNKRHDPLSLSDTVESGVRQVTFNHVPSTVSSKLCIPVSISARFCMPFNRGDIVFGPDHVAGSAALLESTMSAPTGLSYWGIGTQPIASAAFCMSFHSRDVQSLLSLVKSKAKQIPVKLMC